MTRAEDPARPERSGGLGVDRAVEADLRHPRHARTVLIGKTASHGCVRLTNWDAEELASLVKPGVTVEFTN